MLNRGACWAGAYGVSGELLLSRGEPGGHRGGIIGFALCEVREGNGVCGDSWCRLCSYSIGSVEVTKAYMALITSWDLVR